MLMNFCGYSVVIVLNIVQTEKFRLILQLHNKRYNGYNIEKFKLIVFILCIHEIAVKLFVGAQATSPHKRNTPPVEFVITTVLYFVRERIEQAVACVQFLFCKG